MAFTVSVQQFEGPLDLMLHLIKEQKLDLFDLDMNILTEQYLLYLKQLESLHLEVESEYLTELAGLLEYKSKRLLPKEKAELEVEEGEDPKARLVRRLLEYQRFKEVSELFKEQYQQRQLQVGRPFSQELQDRLFHSRDSAPLQGNPYDLVKAMAKCLRRQRLLRPLETRFTQKELSVEDRSLQIRSRLVKLPKTFRFETLLEDCMNLHEAVVTFLAVLDLAKANILFFTVDDEETIWFQRGEA